MEGQQDEDRDDLGGIVHLEHININVTSQGPASVFYFDGLGLTRDPFDRVSDGIRFDSPRLQTNTFFYRYHLGQCWATANPFAIEVSSRSF